MTPTDLDLALQALVDATLRAVLLAVTVTCVIFSVRAWWSLRDEQPESWGDVRVGEQLLLTPPTRAPQASQKGAPASSPAFPSLQSADRAGDSAPGHGWQRTTAELNDPRESRRESSGEGDAA